MQACFGRHAKSPSFINFGTWGSLFEAAPVFLAQIEDDPAASCWQCAPCGGSSDLNLSSGGRHFSRRCINHLRPGPLLPSIHDINSDTDKSQAQD